MSLLESSGLKFLPDDDEEIILCLFSVGDEYLHVRPPDH